MPLIEVVDADLSLSAHQDAVLSLIDAYAQDPMGGGHPLADEARGRLIAGLRDHPTTLIFLAYLDARPVGVAVCFRGFSTFAAKPLINVHDLGVLPDCRGHGIGRHLLQAVERKARALGCCKLTLEVLENNQRARKLYASFGFDQLVYQKDAGGALFLVKPL
jgi:ribosomal protein S18 acetylase RimI-like enzyme